MSADKLVEELTHVDKESLSMPGMINKASKSSQVGGVVNSLIDMGAKERIAQAVVQSPAVRSVTKSLIKIAVGGVSGFVKSIPGVGGAVAGVLEATSDVMAETALDAVEKVTDEMVFAEDMISSLENAAKFLDFDSVFAETIVLQKRYPNLYFRLQMFHISMGAFNLGKMLAPHDAVKDFIRKEVVAARLIS